MRVYIAHNSYLCFMWDLSAGTDWACMWCWSVRVCDEQGPATAGWVWCSGFSPGHDRDAGNQERDCVSLSVLDICWLKILISISCQAYEVLMLRLCVWRLKVTLTFSKGALGIRRASSYVSAYLRSVGRESHFPAPIDPMRSSYIMKSSSILVPFNMAAGNQQDSNVCLYLTSVGRESQSISCHLMWCL